MPQTTQPTNLRCILNTETANLITFFIIFATITIFTRFQRHIYSYVEHLIFMIALTFALKMDQCVRTII